MPIYFCILMLWVMWGYPLYGSSHGLGDHPTYSHNLAHGMITLAEDLQTTAQHMSKTIALDDAETALLKLYKLQIESGFGLGKDMGTMDTERLDGLLTDAFKIYQARLINLCPEDHSKKLSSLKIQAFQSFQKNNVQTKGGTLLNNLLNTEGVDPSKIRDVLSLCFE